MNAVGVAGSRYSHRWLKPALGLWHCQKPITHLVLGCAAGVDSQALEWALDNDVFFVVFTADWDKYGKRAGPLRNGCMVAAGFNWSARWLGFPVGNSPGTHDCMDQAVNAGLEVWRVSSEGKIEGWF